SPTVHTEVRSAPKLLRTAVTKRLCTDPVRRPRSVHRPLEGERVEQRDGVLAAVAGEVAGVAVDHRDARTDEARDREHRNTGAERKGGIGVAHVVEAANGFDAGGDLGGSPVAAAENAEVDPAAARVREEDRVYRGRQPVERLKRLRLQRHARVLSLVLVFLILPFA